MKILPGLILLLALTSPTAFAQDGASDRTYSTAGDAKAGRTAFFKCRACHNLDGDQNPKAGPNLDKIFGRMAGTSDSYQGYSKALRESAIVWSEAALDQWFGDPQNYLPGNKMAFAGIRSEQERKDLIAYLRDATE